MAGRDNSSLQKW